MEPLACAPYLIHLAWDAGVASDNLSVSSAQGKLTSAAVQLRMGSDESLRLPKL